MTAVMDAKRFGKRTLFWPITVELGGSGHQDFPGTGPRATVGRYVESMKQGNAFVVCGASKALP